MTQEDIIKELEAMVEKCQSKVSGYVNDAELTGSDRVRVEIEEHIGNLYGIVSDLQQLLTKIKQQ